MICGTLAADQLAVEVNSQVKECSVYRIKRKHQAVPACQNMVSLACCSPEGPGTGTGAVTLPKGGYTASISAVPGAPVTAAAAARPSTRTPSAADATSTQIGPLENLPSK